MNIIITGASSGIGKAVAEYLTQHGHQVIGTSRSSEYINEGMELMQLDITNNSSVDSFIDKVLQKYKRIDVLINNAGYVLSGPIEDTSISEAQQQLDTNYFGAIRLIQRLLPHFRALNAGKIINICSLAGQIGMPFQAHYSASKFALEGFTEALRLELIPFNIQVCNINPGDFKTSITANRKITSNVTSAYEHNFRTVLSTYREEEENGSDPIIIASLISRLIQKKKLKIRYAVGKPSQTIALIFKKAFGGQIFEFMIKKIWNIK